MDPTVKALLIVAAVAALSVLLLLVVPLFQEQCPKCKRRGALRWDKARGDGQPDRRFKENVKRCARCGAVVEGR